MKLQKAKLLDGRVAWMVLNDDYLPIEPIQKYLRYLDNLSRSPNTIVSYARDLKLYWEFLGATRKSEIPQKGRSLE